MEGCLENHDTNKTRCPSSAGDSGVNNHGVNGDRVRNSQRSGAKLSSVTNHGTDKTGCNKQFDSITPDAKW
jgi:hypothetical protein